MRRAALYLRVSTDKQTTANQERDLRAVAERSGWDIVEVYCDQGISGAKDRDQRPRFDAMLKDATRRRFDVIMAWSVDRLGRSLLDLIGFLNEIHAYGVDLFLHQQSLDTTGPMGKAMFQIMGVFSELERAFIQARVRAGMERAKAAGKRLGRPPVSAATVARIKTALRAGDLGIHKIARSLGVGTAVVQRVKRELVA
jgi:DNA invertase Pin-like site-specific DNA recombinase